ncbi:FAD-dependent pyridine nucleotide-disulfide oxidoreductase [Aspergillus eucalypticola CBS 122712]|uniref:FAD-dependent pyridine nucleotide-disulfide oxidoreductase n=1 Tax=Aspergillus eucalypticola (strain CBS 122712 / IBT 29274) TaxID=1448314 RepID=A0A317VNL5_ASPEC|nr:FAD-dependent pyridine nucleotide-disulfide oxidoreductase [Aspergillus eucalypticola CBS 122712]PWY75954.1 FAD-dependent pyridine nucleotide-disulfide oxidoreductase [Aspergillus eucalypticola CBS 122712]
MSAPTQYDTIIIGSGQGGTPLARALALANHKTALIEREHIGGCCVNDGCTPTKTMIASGRVAYLARRGGEYGVYTPNTSGSNEGDNGNKVVIDMKAIRQRKRDIVNSFRAGGEKRLRDAGVDVIIGEASFVDAKTMVIMDGSKGNERVVRGDRIVINTGCRPGKVLLGGLEKVPSEKVLDSTSIMELGEVPRHLVVVGGGYIGVEFGQLFRRLGAKVTVLQRGEQLLPREDRELADMLLEIFRNDGIEVRLETTPVRFENVSEGVFDVAVETRQGREVVKEATHILFASGRVPNTERLNAAAAGVKTDKRGYVVTNEFLETSAPSIYAIGDVKGPPSLTHISYDDFRVLRSTLLEPTSTCERLSIQDRMVPYVAYTDPQFGHVGLHEQEARERFPGRKILTAQMPMSYVARALETDETRGAMKAVIDGETGQILGFSCLGVEGGEIMSVVQTAMMGNLPYKKLQDAVFAHPTFAESLNNLWGFLN